MTPSASAAVYNRTAAVAYAQQYWDKCVTDGYFWINGSTAKYYGAGAPVPVNVPGEASGIGDDCAHFVSSCIGSPAAGLGGGLTIPNRAGTYGEPGAARLNELLVGSSLGGYGTTYQYATQVSSINQLTPGDVIGYDWSGNGGGSMSGIDHVVIYLGNGLIAAHATSHNNTAWNWGNSSSTITFFVHINLHDVNVPATPTNSAPSSNSVNTSLTPKLTGSAFAVAALGGKHVASQWQIFSGTRLLYDTGTDATNLLSLVVPAGRLSAGNTYTWKVRYEDNYGDWSSYSTATSFSTALVPEPAAAVTAAATLLVGRRRRVLV